MLNIIISWKQKVLFLICKLSFLENRYTATKIQHITCRLERSIKIQRIDPPRLTSQSFQVLLVVLPIPRWKFFYHDQNRLLPFTLNTLNNYTCAYLHQDLSENGIQLFSSTIAQGTLFNDVHNHHRGPQSWSMDYFPSNTPYINTFHVIFERLNFKIQRY